MPEGQFLSILAVKAENARQKTIAVNPSGTTTDCSNCAKNVPKKLSDRIHYCPHCGTVLSRDKNAAIIYKKRSGRAFRY